MCTFPLNFNESPSYLSLRSTVEEALKMEIRSASEQKPAKTDVTPASTPLKRPHQPVVSDYNTRHRDKRVRVSDPGPGLRRKAGRKANGLVEATVRSPKASKSKAAPMTGPTSKGRRTIFDGVVLPRFLPSVNKRKDEADAVVSNGAPPEEHGEEQGEEDGAADQPLGGLEDSRLESSLASSNKGISFYSAYQCSSYVLLRKRT